MFGSIITKAMLSSNVLAKKTGTYIHKNADKILLGVGVGFIVGGTVSAAVSSKNIAKVIDKHKKAIAKVNSIEDQKERGHEKLVVYKDTAIEMLMTFGPCVLLTGTGIACIIGSHHVLTQRLASCQAAYAMLDTSFREYRERVKDVVGAEKELDIYNNASEIEVVDVDEKGKETKRKLKDEKGAHGPYDFKFMKGNPNFLEVPGRNREFLDRMRWYCQDMLNRQGEISLADVLWAINYVEDKRFLPKYTFDVVWRRGSVVLFGHESDADFMADKKKEVWLHFNPDGFRRKLSKEEHAYLNAARETVNDLAYAD